MQASDWISLATAFIAVGATLLAAWIGGKSAATAIRLTSSEEHRIWLRERLGEIYFEAIRAMTARDESRRQTFRGRHEITISVEEELAVRSRMAALASAPVREAFSEAFIAHAEAVGRLLQMEQAASDGSATEVGRVEEARALAERACSGARSQELVVAEMIRAEMRSPSFGGASALA